MPGKRTDATPRTHCRNGLHDFTDPDNVGIDHRGDRYCRPCKRADSRRHQARRKAEVDQVLANIIRRRTY